MRHNQKKNLTKKEFIHACIAANPSGVNEQLNAHKARGMSKNKQKPEIRCKMDTIAVIGNLI
jgi:hypothetical protein